MHFMRSKSGNPTKTNIQNFWLLLIVFAGLAACRGEGEGGESGSEVRCNNDNFFNNGEWVITRQDSSSHSIQEEPFDLFVNGKSCGTTRLLTFSNRLEETTQFPQVFVIYSSGYLRFKSGADPYPPLPFGQSFVL